MLTNQATEFVKTTAGDGGIIKGPLSEDLSLSSPNRWSGWAFQLSSEGVVTRFCSQGAQGLGQTVAIFAIQGVLQSSTGSSLFELLYGRQPWGVLDLLQES